MNTIKWTNDENTPGAWVNDIDQGVIIRRFTGGWGDVEFVIYVDNKERTPNYSEYTLAQDNANKIIKQRNVLFSKKPITTMSDTKELTFNQIKEKLKLSNDYQISDISSEKVRQIYSFNGNKIYTIDKPIAIITRNGGKTHRVIDSKGKTHCYAAPETGMTIITWDSDTLIVF